MGDIRQMNYEAALASAKSEIQEVETQLDKLQGRHFGLKKAIQGLEILVGVSEVEFIPGDRPGIPPKVSIVRK